MNGLGELSRRAFMEFSALSAGRLAGVQIPQSTHSETAETKESMLLHLVDYAMTSAPDLSSIPEGSKYGYDENGRLKFTEKFPAYGHNFEVTIAMTDLAVNYIAVAKRMSTPNNPTTPKKLMEQISPGGSHLDGILSHVDLFAGHFYLRYRHPDNVAWLKEFKKPYDSVTGNINNPILFDGELALQKYASLRQPANRFVSAVIEATSRQIKNMEESPESSGRYLSAHKGLNGALGHFRPPAT
ncbi:hypothetical protein HYX06_01945 [Candidatus Woesearchaeota archaeon]|nr:hypothetical protein [Candidatus Woesearchaeota archaeon]